jgi:NRAMP (natural resistance-associated macrophage protein)-like metal ion transporter
MQHPPRRRRPDDEEAAPVIPHTPSAGPTKAQLRAEPSRARRFFRMLGPGLITGASDDDPSGIATYSVAGASFGFATLWTAIVTLPLMAVVQFICAKVGMVSGRGLAGVLRQHYPRWLLYPVVACLLVANTINAGADIGAVAAGINLLVPGVPIAYAIVPVAALILLLQIWARYRLIANVFKWLTLSLFAYIAAAFLANPQWTEVMKATFVPHLRLDPRWDPIRGDPCFEELVTRVRLPTSIR